MKVPCQNRRLCCGAIAAIVCWGFSALPAAAQVPRPVERAGRIFGFGWGDGYHTCATSKIRLGADLPPRSFTSGHLYRKLAARAAAIQPVGATYYDQFDACCGNFCPSDCYCGGQGCDRCGCEWGCDPCCDDPACDAAPVTVIRGSEVIHGHAVPGPDATDEMVPEIEPTPRPAPIVNPPTGDGASNKASPTRPSAPMVAAAKPLSVRRQPPRIVTPRNISLPAKPTLGLVPAGIPDWIRDDKLNQRASKMAEPTARPATPLAEDPLGDMIGESGLVMPPIEIVGSASQPQRGSVGLGIHGRWQASEPETSTSLAQPSSKPRPTRLGHKSDVNPTAPATRPAGSGGIDFTRPFGRPIVDIADRNSESSDQVVSQPSLRR